MSTLIEPLLIAPQGLGSPKWLGDDNKLNQDVTNKNPDLWCLLIMSESRFGTTTNDTKTKNKLKLFWNVNMQ
jgi:hypothetical protein